MVFWLYAIPAGIVIALAIAEYAARRSLTKGQTSKSWIAKGKVVVITGASSGIGEELAKQYAAQGSRLVLGARRLDRLQEVQKRCLELGSPDCVVVATDVTVEKDCEKFIAAASKFGTIDLLILNAGISMGSYFEDVRDAQVFRELMNVNYLGCVYCLQAAMPLLKKSDSGRVAVVSSVAGKSGPPTRTGYSASKWALQGFFEAFRNEVGPKYGIVVTMICPGPVQSDINKTRIGDPKFQLDMKLAQPVDQACAEMVQAIAAGQRELIMMSAASVGQYLRPFVPWLMDWIVVQKTKSLGLTGTKSTA